MAAGPFTAAWLAGALGADVEGDGSRALVGVAALEAARPDQLSFLANPRYKRKLAASAAGAVLIDRKSAAPERAPAPTLLRCDDPYLAFARALALFHPTETLVPGVDARAYVAPDAVVEGARVEAFAWVGPGAVVGSGTWVEAHAYVGPGATVGAGCRLMPHSVVCQGCALGDRVWLNPGAVVGGEGFGFAPTADGLIKIPQVGRAVIEDDVEIGVNSAVDRAALGETRVRRGAKLDNLVQIGHAADVGEHSCLIAFSGVAGSSRLGRGVTLAAKAAVLGHLNIGDGVTVGVSGVVHDDQPAGARVSGVPAIEHRRWLRAATAMGELPALLRTVSTLERRVAELEARLAGQPAAEPENIEGKP